jgi:EAL domain-containing protein (putative c-di-GMP-specific phosphodiesterase class I)
MESVERNAVEYRVRQAFEAGEFRLYYQSQHDATTNRILGAEALLRWHDPADRSGGAGQLPAGA